jgi:hypothetical protein
MVATTGRALLGETPLTLLGGPPPHARHAANPTQRQRGDGRAIGIVPIAIAPTARATLTATRRADVIEAPLDPVATAQHA